MGLFAFFFINYKLISFSTQKFSCVEEKILAVRKAQQIIWWDLTEKIK